MLQVANTDIVINALATVVTIKSWLNTKYCPAKCFKNSAHGRSAGVRVGYPQIQV